MEYDTEKQVKETIEKYNLIEKNDKVVVALSGGKDSTTTLYILHKLGYNVQGLMIDLDLGEWSKKHKENMENFCKSLNVSLTVVDLKKEIGHGICFIKAILKKEKNLSGCTVCGIIKKYILNKWAKKLGAKEIATGHNLDDETHTVLMNFLKGNVFLGIGSTPKTGINSSKLKDNALMSKILLKNNKLINKSKNNIGEQSEQHFSETPDGFVQRIKPLFFVPENSIREFSKKMNFPILYDKCPCAIGTYRVETRHWTKDLSDKDKLKIVQEFQSKIPELRKRFSGEIMKCSVCGEPSRHEVCNACKIFSYLKK